MVWVRSSLTMSLRSSTCSARVRTAARTSSAARSVRGRNSRFNNAAKSPPAASWEAVSATAA